MHVSTGPLRNSDIPELWTIEQDIWDDSNTPTADKEQTYETFRANLLEENCLVARDDKGQVLGSITYTYHGSFPAIRRQWFLEIGVAKNTQGLGVGRKLIEAVLQKAEEENIGKVSLRVMGTNPNALAFYKHLGFIQEAHYLKEFWINDHWVDDYQFAWYIKEKKIKGRNPD